jgi:hypothetical protein
MGRFFVVLASAVNDSAYVALLDEHFNEVARRSFSSPMYAMLFEYGHMFVVGRNPYGYDINILKLHGGPEAFAKGDIDAFAILAYRHTASELYLKRVVPHGSIQL